MSALCQKQTGRSKNAMSALPPKADIDGPSLNVRFVPKAEQHPISKKILGSQKLSDRPARMANCEGYWGSPAEWSASLKEAASGGAHPTPARNLL